MENVLIVFGAICFGLAAVLNAVLVTILCRLVK